MALSMPSGSSPQRLKSFSPYAGAGDRFYEHVVDFLLGLFLHLSLLPYGEYAVAPH